jgi:hypothetical protein
MKRKDLVGHRFHRLQVTEFSHINSLRNCVWKCLCECGNIVLVAGGHLGSGHTRSCGCYRNEIRKETHRTHGLYNTRLHRIWSAMKARCSNPHTIRFNCYGAKGIAVCEAWNGDFKRFYDWAISHGYAENLTIDRINPDGNYEPSNCQWLTLSENNRKRFADRRSIS